MRDDDVVGATQHNSSILFGGLGCCAVLHQQLILPKNFKNLSLAPTRVYGVAQRGGTTCCQTHYLLHAKVGEQLVV